jgi:hypothetical protein
MCATCLLASQYLTHGIMLMRGKLVVFQCASTAFWYSLVNSITKDFQERVVKLDNFETLGKGEGASTVIGRILIVMQNMHEEDLDPSTSLEVWHFTNSGQSVECTIDVIPNSALNFLRYTLRYGLRNEVLGLVRNENAKGKKINPEYSLINCITRKRDYSRLYPYKDFNGVTIKLFHLFQSHILDVSTESLNTSYKIAQYIKHNTEDKEFEKIRKDLEHDYDKQNMVRKLLVEMVKQGKLNFNEYSELFLLPKRVPIINNHAWKIIHYFLHNVNEELPQLEAEHLAEHYDNYYIRYAATIMYNRLIQVKGREKVEKVLADFGNNKFNVERLRVEFAQAAAIHEGFTYNDYKALCIDGSNERTKEVLFCIRLLVNEWYHNNTQPVQPITNIDKIPLDTDLNDSIKDIIKLIVERS